MLHRLILATHLDLVLNILNALGCLSNIFGCTLGPAVINGAGQGYYTFGNLDLNVARIKLTMPGHLVADFFADAVVGALIALRANAGIASLVAARPLAGATAKTLAAVSLTTTALTAVSFPFI